jgi:hypothetical protein
MNTEKQEAKIQVSNHHKKQGTVSWAEYRNGGFLRVWAVLQLPPAEQTKQGALYIYLAAGGVWAG